MTRHDCKNEITRYWENLHLYLEMSELILFYSNTTGGLRKFEPGAKATGAMSSEHGGRGGAPRAVLRVGATSIAERGSG